MLLPLSADDLARVRFFVSPLWESVAAVRAVLRPGALHRDWARDTMRQMEAERSTGAEHWAVLRAYVRRDGYIADAITPTPTRDESFEDARERVRAQGPSVWLDDVEHLRQADDHAGTAAVLDELEADPAAAVDRLCDALTWFWALAVEPYWPRIQALQIADIEHRLRLLSHGGLEEMLGSLHPQVTRVAAGLDVAGKTCELGGGQHGTGLTLIPCVFAWPGTMVLSNPEYVSTLTYPPRGAGTLWERRAERTSPPLAQLIGATRATILQQLDVPMTTTQLAAQLSMPPATVSEHLRVLAAAGVAHASRRGREVYYARTEVAEALCAADGAVLAAAS